MHRDDGEDHRVIADAASVRFRDRTFSVPPAGMLTFGRHADCTIVLNPADHGVSRVAGTVHRAGQGWFITNRSTKRPLRIIDRGREVVLPVASPEGAARHLIDVGELVVVVTGDVFLYPSRSA